MFKSKMVQKKVIYLNWGWVVYLFHDQLWKGLEAFNWLCLNLLATPYCVLSLKSSLRKSKNMKYIIQTFVEWKQRRIFIGTTQFLSWLWYWGRVHFFSFFLNDEDGQKGTSHLVVVTWKNPELLVNRTSSIQTIVY
jgi:hypothetical protein